jgi:hypothetical protein
MEDMAKQRHDSMRELLMLRMYRMARLLALDRLAALEKALELDCEILHRNRGVVITFP